MENLSQQVRNEISILNNDTRFESVQMYSMNLMKGPNGGISF